MELLWVLLGMAIAFSLLSIYWAILNFRLKQQLKRQSPHQEGNFQTEGLPRLALPASALSANFSQASRADSDERWQNLSQLEQEVSDWQQVMQVAPIGYIQVDEENRLYWSNAQALKLLGIPIYDEKIARQQFLLQLVRSYELDQLIEQTRSQQQPMQKAWVFHQVVPDPLHPVQQQGRPLCGYSIPLEDGKVGIFIEDRLEKVTLTQQRDRWASDVAHELKTPLTSIRLIAETLQPRVESAMRVWIDRLIDEVMRLTNLVEDLLDLGQLDTSLAPKLLLKPVDLPQLIQAAWGGLEPLATRKQVSLTYSGLENLTLQADESRLYRLFLNLLDNSIKHSPEQRAVLVKVNIVKSSDLSPAIQNSALQELETNDLEPQAGEIQEQPQAEQVEIDVIDAGSGFPEEAIPHVFERFYRIDQSRSRSVVTDRGGSGLGLAIAYQIVQLHHGTIQASNHPETGGAWIKVMLPLPSVDTVLFQPSNISLGV
ncbi:HAMP domain-containing sensor histidine kinase [Tumidithrix elongata RA019]|uniref:histidine kinase n=1 Tax=Tumidithrix elongata BACA0141 TaxID=2716417 RepID=A0AAW9PYZ6_9CYAN|nr:HAMP domain-containing sensor histidine kinase [Tumidithrix elongata RA019]